MEKFQCHAVIHYLQRKGLSLKEIKVDFDKTYGEDTTSLYNSEEMDSSIQQGEAELTKWSPSWKTLSAKTKDNIAKVTEMVMADRRVFVGHIATTLGISIGCIDDILKNQHGNEKSFGKMGTQTVDRWKQACAIATTTLRDCGCAVIPHLPNSSDLGPSDFHLLTKLKKDLGGSWFDADDDVMYGVEEFFTTQDKTFFHEGIAALHRR